MANNTKKKLPAKRLAAEIAGWYGAVAILAAYVLVTFSAIESSGLAFQLLNLTGAAGIIVIASYKKVAQSIVLNIVWGIVAIVAITQIVF